MTEAEWQACGKPGPMLAHLGAGKASEREVRLFGVARLREIWMHLLDEIRSVIEAQEAYADGLIDEQTLSSAITKVRPVEIDGTLQTVVSGVRGQRISGPVAWRSENILRPKSVAEWTAWVFLTDDPIDRQAVRVYSAYYRGCKINTGNPVSSFGLAQSAVRKVQADLVREIFGNPFRRPTIDPGWLAWNEGTIPALAAAIYDEKDFDRLPILTDALEEAGCIDRDILDHCRSKGSHVRGCWVLDLLLGRR